MVNDMVEPHPSPCKKKELALRLMSSLALLPMIGLIFLPNNRYLFGLCWLILVLIAIEICSPKIKGHFRLRMAALFFCSLGICAFMFCRVTNGSLGCLALICIASGYDVGGYSFGKIFKGPKMCPKISPNKTWSGLFGGIFFANLLFVLLKTCVKPGSVLLFTPADGLWKVQLLIFAAMTGDLIESLFKRRVGVKDMGRLIPGHGGVWDRLDSLICVSIVWSIINTLWYGK